MERTMELVTRINVVIRWVVSQWRNIMFGDILDPDKWKISKALRFLAQSVRNRPAYELLLLDDDPNATQEQYIDATVSFLNTLVAFNKIEHILDYIDVNILNKYDIDVSGPHDVPMHYLRTH